MTPPLDLVTALRRHTASDGDRTALTWLPGLGPDGIDMTYTEIDVAAATTAAAILGHARPGDRILLVQPPGLGFVSAFIGSLYADCVPVPVYPLVDTQAGAAIVRRIVDDCGAALALVADEGAIAPTSQALGLPAISVDGDKRHYPQRHPDLDAPAFLQYTSGSTGAPKGVVVTRGNLAANLAAIASAFGHDRDAVTLSWLPAYHDMGLIGNILHPLHTGCHAHLASPLDFIRRPLAWIEAIARCGVTTSGAPNFAYDMVVKAAEVHGVPEVGLQRWTKAYSGAEPVSAATLRRFAEMLAPRGFDPAAFIPCYGLAEATLLVTARPIGTGAVVRASLDGVSAVSCGVPHGCEVAVVNENGVPTADREIGEIRVRGSGVAHGYWHRTETSADVFGSTVSGRSGAWLRTGDLGFLAEGELHVTGRIKEMLIVRGRNYYPHDLERLAADRLPDLRPGSVVAFADDAGDGVVIVVERRGRQPISAADRARLAADVAATSGVRLSQLVAVPPGAIPKTTSGKLRRGECRRRYLDGEYGRADAAAASATGSTVRDVVREVLGADVPDDEPLLAHGLDSLRAIQLAERLAVECGRDVPVRLLLTGGTVADILAHRDTPVGTSAEPAGRLSRAQEALAFLQMLDPSSDEYNLSYAWSLGPDTDVEAFDEALRLAVMHQPELAMRIVVDGAERRRERVPQERMRDVLALVLTPVRDERLDEQLADAAAVPFALTDGPLLRVYAWQTPTRRVYQIVVHHIVTDMWSLSLLLRDLGAAYTAIVAGRPARLDRKASYDSYVADQAAFLASEHARNRDAYLHGLLPRRAEPVQMRTDRPRLIRRSSRAGRIRQTLPAEVVDGLRPVDQVAVLTALWIVCLRRYGTPDPVVVGVPVAGRTVGRHAAISGLCTNTVPIALRIDPRRRLKDVSADVRAQLVAGIDAGLYPLARAVEIVQPERSPGRTPLVESMVAVQHNPLGEVPGLLHALAGEAAELHCGDLTLYHVPVARQTGRCDLDLVVTPRDADIVLTLDYAADLFEPATAEAVLTAYAAMVTAAAANPNATVRDVSVLSTPDRLLLDLIGTASSPPADGAVAMIRRVARDDPGRPAVVDAAGTVDFHEFVQRVDRVATALARAVSTGEDNR